MINVLSTTSRTRAETVLLPRPHPPAPPRRKQSHVLAQQIRRRPSPVSGAPGQAEAVCWGRYSHACLTRRMQMQKARPDISRRHVRLCWPGVQGRGCHQAGGSEAAAIRRDGGTTPGTALSE